MGISVEYFSKLDSISKKRWKILDKKYLFFKFISEKSLCKNIMNIILNFFLFKNMQDLGKYFHKNSFSADKISWSSISGSK